MLTKAQHPTFPWIHAVVVQRTVQIVNTANGSVHYELKRRFECPSNSATPVALSADAQLVASISRAEFVEVWRTSEGTLMKSVLLKHLGSVGLMVFSPDGLRLATCGTGGTETKVWSIVPDSKLPPSVVGHSGPANCLAFSPDGQMLAIGSDDKTAKICVVSNNRINAKAKIVLFSGHTGPVKSVAFCDDGRSLATGSSDRSLRIWSVDDGRCLHVLTGHQAAVNAVAFCEAAKVVASGSADHSVKLWSTADGRLLQSMACRGGVNAIAFSANGEVVASGSSESTVQLWKVSDGSFVQTLARTSAAIRNMTFSPTDGALVTSCDDSTVSVWYPTPGKVMVVLNGHRDAVKCVGFSGDGSCIATWSEDRTIRTWNSSSGEQLRTLDGSFIKLLRLSLSYDGLTVATASEGSITFWNASSGAAYCTHSPPAVPPFIDFVLSPVGRFAVTWRHGLCLTVLSRDGRPTKSVLLPSHVSCVTSRGLQCLVVSCVDGSFNALDAATGVLQRITTKLGKPPKELIAHPFFTLRRFITESDPRWQRDSQSQCCFLCKAPFGVLLRRHHCRVCGRSGCDDCTSHKVTCVDLSSDKNFKVVDGQRCCQECSSCTQEVLLRTALLPGYEAEAQGKQLVFRDVERSSDLHVLELASNAVCVEVGSDRQIVYCLLEDKSVVLATAPHSERKLDELKFAAVEALIGAERAGASAIAADESWTRCALHLSCKHQGEALSEWEHGKVILCQKISAEHETFVSELEAQERSSRHEISVQMTSERVLRERWIKERADEQANIVAVHELCTSDLEELEADERVALEKLVVVEHRLRVEWIEQRRQCRLEIENQHLIEAAHIPEEEQTLRAQLLADYSFDAEVARRMQTTREERQKRSALAQPLGGAVMRIHERSVEYDHSRELGRGATATVFAATVRAPNRVQECAYKKLAPGPDRSALRELIVLSRLRDSSAFVRLLALVHANDDADFSKPIVGMLLERMAGDLMSHVVTNRSKLRTSDLLKLLGAVASGMDIAHRRGVIHADLKPHNILVSRFGLPFIADLGSAHQTCNTAQTMQAFSALTSARGTALYIAPELVGDATQLSTKSDVFSFGMTVWRVFHPDVLQPLRSAGNDLLLLDALCRGERPLITDARVTPELSSLIAACWNADPSQRPSMAEVESMLAEIIEQVSDAEAKRDAAIAQADLVSGLLTAELNAAVDFTQSYCPLVSACETIRQCRLPFLTRAHLDQIAAESRNIALARIRSLEAQEGVPAHTILSEDQATALCAYTYDLGCGAASNLYYQLNLALNERAKDGRPLAELEPYLYYLCDALTALPAPNPSTGRRVYRGMGGDKKSAIAAAYSVGQAVFWSAFTSTTPNISVAETFAGHGGIVFRITTLTGREIRAYSALQGEEEVLLPPNIKFTVANALHVEDDGYFYVDLLEQRFGRAMVR